MSTSSGGRLDELKSMIQSLFTGVQNSGALGEASASAIAGHGNGCEDGHPLKVDLIEEEEVAATKKILEKRTRELRKWMRQSRNVQRKSNRWRKKLLR